MNYVTIHPFYYLNIPNQATSDNTFRTDGWTDFLLLLTRQGKFSCSNKSLSIKTLQHCFQTSLDIKQLHQCNNLACITSRLFLITTVNITFSVIQKQLCMLANEAKNKQLDCMYRFFEYLVQLRKQFRNNQRFL